MACPLWFELLYPWLNLLFGVYVRSNTFFEHQLIGMQLIFSSLPVFSGVDQITHLLVSREKSLGVIPSPASRIKDLIQRCAIWSTTVFKKRTRSIHYTAIQIRLIPARIHRIKGTNKWSYIQRFTFLICNDKYENWQIDAFSERLGFAITSPTSSMLLHPGMCSKESCVERR